MKKRFCIKCGVKIKGRRICCEKCLTETKTMIDLKNQVVPEEPTTEPTTEEPTAEPVTEESVTEEAVVE